MNFIGNNKSINFLGEFSDHSLEREFFQQDMEKAIRYIKPIVLILGILYTLFLIPDYFLIHNKNTFMLIAECRILLILLIAELFIRIKRMKDFRVLAYWITLCEIVSVLLFLFIFYQYESPNYLIQAFGVIVIIIAVFMVPNRWLNMIIVSLLVSISFIAMSVYYLENIKVSEFSAGVVYIGIVTVLCSVIAFRNNYYKRIQYTSSKELIRLSITDYLSGAYNRVKMDEELKRLVTYSKENDTPLSLMILDFDNFKKINDTYGHLVGDNVIVESSALIQNNIREVDIFARWGGEEFVLILPNVDKAHAADMAERLREIIASHSFKEVERVTCSFGVVQLSRNDDIESLLRKVDKMLYRAKRSGKNTVNS